MSRPRILMLIMLSFAAIVSIGRVLLELTVWLAGGAVHASLTTDTGDWIVVGLIGACMVMVSAALWRPRNKLPRGVNSLLVLLACATLLGCSSCATMKEQGRELAGDVVDCMTDQAKQLDEQFGPTVDKVLELAMHGDGGIDWPTVKDATRQFATDSAKCVLARSVARLMKPQSRDPNAPQSEGLEVDRDRLQSAWRQMADGKTYRTPDGDI